MLVAKIEVWPHGRVEKAKEVRRLFIANRGRSPAGDPGGSLYSYSAWLGEPNSVWLNIPSLADSRTKVVMFDHDRGLGAEQCVSDALRALGL